MSFGNLLVVKKQSNVEHMRPWRGEPEEKGTPTASGQQFSTPEEFAAWLESQGGAGSNHGSRRSSSTSSKSPTGSMGTGRERSPSSHAANYVLDLEQDGSPNRARTSSFGKVLKDTLEAMSPQSARSQRSGSEYSVCSNDDDIQGVVPGRQSDLGLLQLMMDIDKKVVSIHVNPSHPVRETVFKHLGFGEDSDTEIRGAGSAFPIGAHATFEEAGVNDGGRLTITVPRKRHTKTIAGLGTLGLRMSADDNDEAELGVRVINVIGHAEAAGLLVGDFVIEVNGQDVSTCSFKHIQQLFMDIIASRDQLPDPEAWEGVEIVVDRYVEDLKF